MNNKNIKTVYEIIKISLSLKYIKEEYYNTKTVTLEEIQEAVKQVMEK